MTSYAPPSIDYFSGLQFNPNIYENPLVNTAYKLFGALVTIIGTISVIITAPLIRFNTGTLEIGNATPTSVNFMTNPSLPNVSTSSIVASGGTTANTGTMTITNATLNLNSSVGTDFNNTRVRLTGTSPLYGDTSGSGDYLPLFDVNLCTHITGAITLTMSSVTRESMFIIPWGTATSFTITLNTSAVRDGSTFHIYNFGTGTITVFGGSGRMFGNGYTVGGQGSIALGSGVGRSFRACTRGSLGNLGNQNNNAAGWYVH